MKCCCFPTESQKTADRIQTFTQNQYINRTTIATYFTILQLLLQLLTYFFRCLNFWQIGTIQKYAELAVRVPCLQCKH